MDDAKRIASSPNQFSGQAKHAHNEELSESRAEASAEIEQNLKAAVVMPEEEEDGGHEIDCSEVGAKEKHEEEERNEKILSRGQLTSIRKSVRESDAVQIDEGESNNSFGEMQTKETEIKKVDKKEKSEERVGGKIDKILNYTRRIETSRKLAYNAVPISRKAKEVDEIDESHGDDGDNDADVDAFDSSSRSKDGKIIDSGRETDQEVKELESSAGRVSRRKRMTQTDKEKKLNDIEEREIKKRNRSTDSDARTTTSKKKQKKKSDSEMVKKKKRVFTSPRKEEAKEKNISKSEIRKRLFPPKDADAKVYL